MIIIDDAVDKPTQDLIENMIFKSDMPRWVYHRAYNTVKRVPPISSEIVFPSFFFDIVKANNHRLVDPSYGVFLSPIARFNPKSIFKVRCVLNQPIRTDERLCMPSHLDALPEHYHTEKFNVAVYYVNDSDGPTIFYDETYESAKQKGLSDKDLTDNKMNVKQKVEPKKGRLVMFDGNLFHSTGIPKNNVRSIINYNFLC